jgi:hypothetical protein
MNGGLLKKGKAIYGIGKKKSQILHLALFKTEIVKNQSEYYLYNFIFSIKVI